MHITFLNPQGNFDQNDSYLTEHPDFGGQLIYVKEVAMAMAKQGHKVDIVTRRIVDPDWPEFSEPIGYYAGYEESLRILRFDCGGPKFLKKEQLWPHLEEFVQNMRNYYGDALPDFSTAHYADGGYCAALFKHLTGTGFTFTGHSLGAQKLDKLGTTSENWQEMQKRFHFAQRIDAERLGMREAYQIITSTDQERFEQYSHPLYKGAVDVDDARKFSVIPPGVNTGIFTTEESADDAPVRSMIEGKLKGKSGPVVVVSSRLDEKKNIQGVVDAFAGSKALRERASLVICIRGIDDPYSELDRLPDADRNVLAPILETILSNDMRGMVHFLNLKSQKELAATYRILAQRGSVFALTAFYEPFGLAPPEAAACGLACVATKNGGPSEIFEDGSGILVDPYDQGDIAQGLLFALENYSDLSKRSRARVLDKYTWSKTAARYLNVVEEGIAAGKATCARPAPPDATVLIRDYLDETGVS